MSRIVTWIIIVELLMVVAVKSCVGEEPAITKTVVDLPAYEVEVYVHFPDSIDGT